MHLVTNAANDNKPSVVFSRQKSNLSELDDKKRKYPLPIPVRYQLISVAAP